MITNAKVAILIEKLEKLSKKEITDEENLYFGGNMDDAYMAGIEDGQYLLAMSLLKDLFGE